MNTATGDTLLSASLIDASTVPAGASIVGSFNNGLVADGLGKGMRIPQANNIDLNRGTMEVVFTPNFNADDCCVKRDVFGTGQWNRAGTIGLGKHNQANNMGMFVQAFDGPGAIEGFIENDNFNPNGYDWVAGQTVTIRMAWDHSQDTLPHVRVWLDGRELPWTIEHPRTPHLMPTAPTDSIYVGGGSRTDTVIFGDGTYRDLLILSGPVPPSD